METTRRRFASTISCLASRSPRSMRLARATSRSAGGSAPGRAGAAPALGGGQRRAADGAQVEPERVERRLDGQIDLRLARRVGLLAGAVDRALEAAALGHRGAAVLADHVDALLLEVSVQLGDLFLGH